MKILFSGHHNPHFFTITEYLERAIRSLGHELFIFEDRQHIVPGRIRARLPLLNQFDQKIINKRMASLAAKALPDIAIVTGGLRISSDTVKTLKHHGAKCILWTTDPPKCFQSIIDVAPFYDHIFCQGTEANELLSRAGIKSSLWLPMACDPFYHHPVDVSKQEKAQFECDLAFVGSFYPNRSELLEKLAEFDLKIWGPGWDRLAAESSLRKHIRGLHVAPETWIKIYSAGKIVIVSHYQDLLKRIPVYQASPKIFEAMACGAFVISDNQRDVFKLFQSGVHLEVFNDLDELKKKIVYYLNHPKERSKIARQGRQEVVNNHTYIKRIEDLLSVVHRNREND